MSGIGGRASQRGIASRRCAPESRDDACEPDEPRAAPSVRSCSTVGGAVHRAVQCSAGKASAQKTETASLIVRWEESRDCKQQDAALSVVSLSHTHGGATYPACEPLLHGSALDGNDEGMMQALEMEEVESLVGHSRRKLQQSRSKLGQKKKDEQTCLAAVAQTRYFVAKLLLVACLAFVLVLGLSAHSKDPVVPLSLGGSVAKDQTASASAAAPAHNVSATAASQIPSAATETPHNKDTRSSSTPPPLKQSSRVLPSPNLEPKTKEEMLYSKYATIVPLPQIDMADQKTKDELGAQWGHWHFWDGDEDTRPTQDFTVKYPNRDVPADDFPEEAWQSDAVFVNHYLNDADNLISRAKEAIFTEYGYGKPLSNERLAERMKMFHWDKIDLSTQTTAPPLYARRGSRSNGGWTTQRSFDGLVRRLLHAMITQDTFTVVLGGHSAAAGHGNHFRQSYAMQFHKIMKPIFARLGVKLVTRNMAQGGLGTGQAALGSGSIYGDCDLLLWDSGMTENFQPEIIDLYLRQGLLSGTKVPVVWGGNFEILRLLHEEADVDVGEFGNGMDGIIPVESEEQAKQVPWAARYMKCAEQAQHLCQSEPRYCATCWIDRDDVPPPSNKKRDDPRGQVKWHPGWRPHQLQGRVLAFAVLDALSAAVTIFSENTMAGPPLDESFWHVTEYYENIRNKLQNMDMTKGRCPEIEKFLPQRLCTTPMKGRTQYTPRADPENVSLTSIIKPASDGYVPKNTGKLLYEGPDAHNKCYDIPPDGVDVFNIVAGRRRNLQSEADGGMSERFDTVVSTLEEFEPSIRPEEPTDDSAEEFSASNMIDHRQLDEVIVPGKGWQVFGEPAGYCDGTFEAHCGIEDVECPLYGHHDGRGSIIGNAYSGWLVMTLSDLKEGIIIVKLHTWHSANDNSITAGWTSVNNERRRNLRESATEDGVVETDEDYNVEEGEQTHRKLGGPPELPENMLFDYAIDGKITTLNKEQFLEKKKQVQRVVETVTLLDDPSFTSDAKNVEVAIRLRNCGRECTFGVSHIYWA